MNFCFFFYQNNDIDHMAPVAWRLLESGHRVHGVLLNADIDATGDHRLTFLRTHPGYSELGAWRALGSRLFRVLFRENETRRPVHLLRAVGLKLGLTTALARRFLRRERIDACIFEYGIPEDRNKPEFFRAAHGLGLPSHSLPHGMHMFVNGDYNPVASAAFQEGSKPFAASSRYDSVITQSRFHGRQLIELGIDGDKVFVLGSARFCPQWIKVNIGLYPPFKASATDEGLVRCVFMLPHWDYAIDRAATLSLIHRLAELDCVYLVVKDHPRGSGKLPEDERNRLKSCATADYAPDIQSVPLIRWADAVINISSSIGLEVIAQKKPLINPVYLHNTRTVIEQTQAAILIDTEEGLIEALAACRTHQVPSQAQEGRSLLERTLVYGQSEPFDVLEAHERFLAEGWRPTPLGKIALADDEIQTHWPNAEPKAL